MMTWGNKGAVDVPPVLDTAYLQRLQNHLGEDVTRELMADGILELSDRLDRLDALASAGQIGELRKLTHDITGAAGHLGLSALSFHAAEANRALHPRPGAFAGVEGKQYPAPGAHPPHPCFPMSS